MFNELNLNNDIRALKTQYKALEQQYKNLLLKYKVDNKNNNKEIKV